jgi:hypothetical protein
MVAVILPVVLLAVIGLITLGLSFLCIEILLRLIGRGLSETAAVPVANNKAGRRAVRRAEALEPGDTGRLRTITAH